MEQINTISTEQMPLKALLRLHDVKLWQIVRRCLSNGVHVREDHLSRCLNGIDVPEDKLKRQLDMIEKELIKLNPPKENLKKCLQLIKKELKQLETQIATD